MDEAFAIAMARSLARTKPNNTDVKKDPVVLGLTQTPGTVNQAARVAPKEKPSPVGKITSYNWKGDPYTDSNSRRWVGSWERISEIGMAVSPDVERKFRATGILPKDKVEIELSDGTKMIRVWDNRTMQDKQAIRKFGKPLTGRFDLHHPYSSKPHDKDGLAVVGFKKYSAIQ